MTYSLGECVCVHAVNQQDMSRSVCVREKDKRRASKATFLIPNILKKVLIKYNKKVKVSNNSMLSKDNNTSMEQHGTEQIMT